MKMPRSGQYHLRDIPSLLSTPVGRRKFQQLLWHSTWPVMRQVAGLYRRTLARKCRVVAVVGSFGKTTTSRAVASALGGDIGLLGGHNALNGVAMGVLGIRPGNRYAVQEVGIEHVGEMRPYAEMLRPDITVVTAVGSEHNRSFGTLEATRAEKSEMVRALPASGLAVLNGDDPNVMWMARQTSADVIRFGFGEGSEVRASNVVLDWPHGMRFRLHVDGQTVEMHTKLIGRHMVLPILAGVAVAVAEGLTTDQTLDKLRTLAPTTGRMQPFALGNNVFLLRDDFKSTLETINVALDTFAEIPAQRRVLVLGDVSEPVGQQRPIYRALGERIAQIASRVILIGHSFQRYSAGAKQANMPRSAIVDAGASVLKAIDELKRTLEAGDVVLIKGRDTQRLERVACALQGRRVRCDIRLCRAKALPCSECPMLEKAWGRQRIT